jgi:mycothiol synthase
MRYRFRPPTEDDVAAITAVIRACELAAYGEAEFDEEQARVAFRVVDPARDAWVVEDAERRIVAAALVRRRHATRLRSFAEVHPEHTGRGIGSALLERIEARARELAGEVPQEEVRLGQDVPVGNEPARGLLQARGFEYVRRFWKMSIDLAEEPPAPEWPDEIRVATMLPGEERAVFDASEDAFADHWDHVPHDYDEWRVFMVERESFDPSLWILARDEDEIAAFSLCTIAPDEGYVGVIGTRRPWRRRGLALALLHESFRRLRARGAARCGLYVDAANPTGATRLYERAGMHVVRESDVFTKRVSPE